MERRILVNVTTEDGEAVERFAIVDHKGAPSSGVAEEYLLARSVRDHIEQKFECEDL
jgi:hypothetical protein